MSRGRRVSIERLQGDAGTRLIDRGDIKQALDQALAEDTIGVICLIADGGIGKTAIVYDWLAGLDVDVSPDWKATGS